MSRKKKLSTAEVISNAEKIFHDIRWKNGIVVCPYCGSIHIKEYNGYKYKCNHCKNRFSDRTKTLMHGSKLSIGVWMQAIYEMMVDNFISSNVLAVKLGINQKSAWLLQTKLRYSMEQDRWLLEGVIAQDEAYIGGCLSNYHYSRKWDLLRKGGFIEGNVDKYTKSELYALNASLKQPVFGMNDGKRIILRSTPNPIKKEYIRYIYNKHVVGDSVTVSDESKLYEDWTKFTGAELHTNNHHENHYITEDGYTSNRIENTFSWYKRGFGGRITHCKYHQFYLNEFVFRYNTRELSTEDRFNTLIASTIGKHITYNDIRTYNAYGDLPKVKVYKKNKFTLDEIRNMLHTGIYSSIEQNGRVYTKDNIDLILSKAEGLLASNAR